MRIGAGVSRRAERAKNGAFASGGATSVPKVVPEPSEAPFTAGEGASAPKVGIGTAGGGETGDRAGAP